MAADRDTVVRLLTSIDASLKKLVGQQQAVLAAAPKPVADAKDLDSPHGDPVLRFTVRNWTGAPYKGRRFSECPPALLDMIADSLEYFARKDDEENAVTNNGKPKSVYRRADAARARGWAKRMRDGHMTHTNEPPPFVSDEDAAADDSFAEPTDSFGGDDSFD